MDRSLESKVLYGSTRVETGRPLLPQSLDCICPLRWNPDHGVSAHLEPIRESGEPVLVYLQPIR